MSLVRCAVYLEKKNQLKEYKENDFDIGATIQSIRDILLVFIYMLCTNAVQTSGEISTIVVDFCVSCPTNRANL